MRDGGRRKWVALATLWTLAIMAVCWLPLPMFSAGGGGGSSWRIPHMDKVIHAGIFTVFGLLWLRAVPGRRRFVIVVLAGVALAATTEIVQSLPALDREGDFLDGVADSIGVLLALVIDYAMLRGSEAREALTGAARA